MVIRVKILEGINWTNYRNYCEKKGLADGDFKIFKKYMEERGIKRYGM